MKGSPIGIIYNCIKPAGQEEGDKDAGPKELFCKGENAQWLIHIGGSVRDRRPESAEEAQGRDRLVSVSTVRSLPFSEPPAQLIGGVAVPLYVLVFALWGGAVNMLRRVSEYQWRGMDVKDMLTKEQARECLIFEMTQVLAAPLLAITAYYLLEPSTQKTAIALGFASGFASHTVLLAIRAVTDTLTPARVTSLRPESQQHPVETRDNEKGEGAHRNVE